MKNKLICGRYHLFKKRHNRLWNGGNGVGTITLYHNNKIIDVIEAKNIDCEYGEFDQ